VPGKDSAVLQAGLVYFLAVITFVLAGPGKNDNAEKVAEKLEALSVKEAGDEAEAEEKSEEKQ
jgi:Ran-binding protein 1